MSKEQLPTNVADNTFRFPRVTMVGAKSLKWIGGTYTVITELNTIFHIYEGQLFEDIRKTAELGTSAVMGWAIYKGGKKIESVVRTAIKASEQVAPDVQQQPALPLHTDYFQTIPTIAQPTRPEDLANFRSPVQMPALEPFRNDSPETVIT